MDFLCSALGLGVFLLSGYFCGFMSELDSITLYTGIGFSITLGLTAAFAYRKNINCMRIAAISCTMLFTFSVLGLLINVI